jgi:hypothetical protein
MRAIVASGRVFCAVAALSITAAGARAGLNSPIAFSQPGAVTITLNASSGGFDHILELAGATGPVGTPVLALTDLGAPSSDVLGHTPAGLGDSAAVGSFTAGEELIFRLTNIESARLGTPGTVADQTFSGSASINNPTPANYYTLVDELDPLTIRVFWEDAFPFSPDDLDAESAIRNGEHDLSFTLTLSPVPEPSALLILAMGGVLAGLIQRRR